MSSLDLEQQISPLSEFIPNNEQTFEYTDDIGLILRTLRENQGWTQVVMAKKMGLTNEQVSRIERSLSEIPSEPILRIWLKKLGCKDNINKILRIAKTYRVHHHLKLKSGDKSNADLIRLIDAYRYGTLSELDRSLLSVIAHESD